MNNFAYIGIAMEDIKIGQAVVADLKHGRVALSRLPEDTPSELWDELEETGYFAESV